MTLSLKPRHLKRYKDIAVLIAKYGRSDIVRASGIEAALEEPLPEIGADALPKANQLAADLEALGPTFIKVGQFLSTRPDVLPVLYLEALARLQDSVEPFPFAEVERIVAEELGVRLSKAFTSFDDQPLAAASLGQVHRATLRDGRPVAVKVQRPAIQGQILDDLDAFEEIATFIDRHTEVGRKVQFQGMLVEFRRALLAELDYRQEAGNLLKLSRQMERFERIVVPCPVEDYCTARVLTMDFIRGRKITSVSPLRRMEVDGEVLADELCRAYLHQTLVDGFFHADPHPGNVFLTDDGRIALLDLGMVAHLSQHLQELLLRLLLAVSEGRGDDAAEILREVGEPVGEDSRSAAAAPDLAGFRRDAIELVMMFSDRPVGEIQEGRLLLELGRIGAEHGLRMPRELTLLGKALLNIDRVATAIAPDFDPSQAIRRYATELTRRRMRKRLSPGKLFAGALELTEFVEKLPRRLNSLIENVARNDFRIRVDAIDEATLMVGMQKVANRITLGLVLAALIVGAALLMRVETSFRLFGYPGLAIVLFLIAAVSGLWLALTILIGDLHDRKPGR